MILTVETVILLVLGLAALTLNLRRDLMMLQLNSYRNERYGRWFKQSEESTSSMRILSCVALFLILVYNMPFVATSVVADVILLWEIVKLITSKYKKPLVWTARAKRIFTTSALLSAFIIAATAVTTGLLVGGSKSVLAGLYAGSVATLALNLLSPFVALIANVVLKPVEKRINKGYYDDAARILRSMPDLKIVGVTGSYGKTSTKHYLHRILSEKYDVMMTPGSYNTTMGVIRTIREYLKPYNEVFIVEMGAKQTGDIKEICDLVHPAMGIVTAVGEQHLESFKTIENVQRTKFELVDALPNDGLAVVNNDFPYVANRKVDNVECVRYGVSNPEKADFTARDISTDHTGTTFTVTGPDGLNLKLHTRLVGECNVSNLIAAVIIALRLGVEAEKIRYAVDKIEQVEHRLNLKRTPGGVTIIDDAFNSNPTGSRMALDVLASMKGGKRILVTPGMIELGDRRFELNRALGEHAAKSCDVAIVVNQYNRQAIVEGLEAGGMKADSIHAVDTFTQAQKLLATMLAPGDTVLYENDLPDTFK